VPATTLMKVAPTTGMPFFSGGAPIDLIEHVFEY
jgi:hypothetical protein